MTVGRRACTCILILGLAACSSESAALGTLVDHTLWQVLELEDDPFAARAPEVIRCSPGGYSVEGQGTDQIFEVDTSICNFITVTQPAPRALYQGDTLEWSMWHLTLVNFEVAQAYVAVMLGDTLLSEKTIPIPGPAAAYAELFELSQDYPAGAPITLHLQNHGNNSWRFHKFGVVK